MDQLKQRYTTHFPGEGTTEKQLDEIEKALGIRLPESFGEISAFYSGAFPAASATSPFRMIGNRISGLW